MRIGAAAAGLAIAIAACSSSSAAPRDRSGHAASAACGPRGARTLAADRSARVYALGRDVYGCANATGRRYLLGHNPPPLGQERVGPIALAGVVAAYGLTRAGVDTATAQVTVRRLDTGRTLHALAATTQPLGPESLQSVGSIVVKSDGAVAWIGAADSIVRHSRIVEVDRADGRGQARLDSGPRIDPSSLRLRGSRLSWRDGGAVRSSSLA